MNNHYYDEEIELKNLLLVVREWKYFIGVVTIIFVFAAGIYCAITPKIYTAQMVVKSGVYDVDKRGKELHVESLNNIKSLFMSDSNEIVSNAVSELMKKDKTKRYSKVTASVDKVSNTVKITFESENMKNSKLLLKKIFNRNSVKYLDKLKIILKPQYESLKNFEYQLKANTAHVEAIVGRVEDLQDEIKKIHSHSFKMNRQNRINKIENRNLYFLFDLYLNQKRMELVRDIKEDLFNLTQKKEELEYNIKNLNLKIDSIKEIIEDDAHLMDLKLVKEPFINESKTTPKIKLIILFSLFTGLSISLFLAFLFNYFIKDKHKDI